MIMMRDLSWLFYMTVIIDDSRNTFKILSVGLIEFDLKKSGLGENSSFCLSYI